MSGQSRIPSLIIALSLVLPGALAAEERPVLELSLEEAVARAMENNVDIEVERFGPQASEFSVTQAEGFYDPSLDAFSNWVDRTTPQSSAFTGGAEVQTKSFNFNFGASQSLKTGGELSLSFDNSRQDTDSIFTTFNPSYNSTITAQFVQPLLKNRKIDVGRNEIRVAKKNKQISDVQFRQQVVNIRADVQKRYYDVIAAIDNLATSKKSLELAKKLLQENQIKVRVGTLAPLDVVEAESEVATREEGVITAEGLLEDIEDALKRTIFPEYDRQKWAVRIVPTDRFEAEPVLVDVEAALQRALEERTDLVAARLGIETSEYTVELAKDQQKPALNLIARYGGTGVGGNFLIRGGLGGEILDTIEGGYGDAVAEVPDLDGRSAVLVSHPQPPGEGDRRPGRGRSGSAASHRAPARAADRNGGANRRPGRGDQLQARRVDARGSRAAGAPPRRRGEEVRGRHVDELPGDPGPA
jgi:outer membrane protein TolC